MKTIYGENVYEVMAVELTSDGRELVVLENGDELDDGISEDGMQYAPVFDEDTEMIVGYVLE